MNNCTKAHVWRIDECLHCKIQELEAEVRRLRAELKGVTTTEGTELYEDET